MALGERGDFEMHSGDDLDLVVTVFDEADAVVVISGATAARWQLGRLDDSGERPKPARPGAPLISKSLGSGIELVASGVSGQLTVTLEKTDTDALRGGDYYHELELDLGGKRNTVLWGVADIQDDLAT